jgi:preprotein translocase subunit YajC
VPGVHLHREFTISQKGMRLNLLQILAQVGNGAATKPTPAPRAVDMIAQFFPFLLIIGVMVLLMFRSKSKEEKQRKSMLSNLKKGDEVQTIGGALAKVVEVRDDRVLLKVDESSNTKIWFKRSAIGQVLSQEKTESK